jgi:hypothetical protein
MADWPSAQVKQRQAAGKAQEATDDSARRQRQSGRKVRISGPGDAGIEILDKSRELAQRIRRIEFLHLAFEPAEACLDLAHLDATPAYERIGMRLEPGNALRAVHSQLRCILIESLENALQFVDRAAESLPVLLRELGQL